MNNFKYIQPKDLKDASKLLGKDGKTNLVYAGGTDLLGLMKDKIEAPENLINLKSIAGLDNISYQKGKGVRIGALVTLAQIVAHPLIKEKFTALAEAAAEVATPQLRNMGTLGGNICQRPRCWYYRGEFNCLRKGGDSCYAVDGKNKYHCIIGGGPCFIVHPSDTAVALMALDASVVISAGKKSRKIPMNDFFVLPQKNVERENILKPGEIITEIIIPDTTPGTRSGYLKFRERASWDFAMVSVAAVIHKNGTAVKSAKVVYGGVAPIPWLDEKVTARLSALQITEENLQKLTSDVLTDAEPLQDNEYKVALAKNLTGSLLTKLTV